ncbi:MAG: hypothetical protein GY847_09895 [Proteobacteria bacterium]|nr:hypothetical protein [Pseudomonadota bacterium]
MKSFGKREVRARIGFSGPLCWPGRSGWTLRPAPIVAAVTDPASIRRYLEGTGLPSEIPEIKPASPQPQLDFEYEDTEYETDW